MRPINGDIAADILAPVHPLAAPSYVAAAVVDAARKGDIAAAKIILDRLAPIRRSATFVLPDVEKWTDIAAMRKAILTAVSEGDLMPGEAVDVNKLVALFVSAARADAPSNDLLALVK